MRRVRTTLALGCASAALLVGIGSSASAATPADQPTASTASDPYQFGVYYNLEACQYFGNSLVQGGAFSSYNCVYEWDSSDQQGYWHLYMW